MSGDTSREMMELESHMDLFAKRHYSNDLYRLI